MQVASIRMGKGQFVGLFRWRRPVLWLSISSWRCMHWGRTQRDSSRRWWWTGVWAKPCSAGPHVMQMLTWGQDPPLLFLQDIWNLGILWSHRERSSSSAWLKPCGNFVCKLLEPKLLYSRKRPLAFVAFWVSWVQLTPTVLTTISLLFCYVLMYISSLILAKTILGEFPLDGLTCLYVWLYYLLCQYYSYLALP